MQGKDFQNPVRWFVRAACLTLLAAVLYACGSDDAPAGFTSTPFTSSSATATAAAELINLSALNNVALGAAGEGVAVAAVVRNLPDLAAGELMMKATGQAGGIQLRTTGGSRLIPSGTDDYLAAHDLGRFGDGTFIAHILAGQSAGETVDIPGISPGVDDLDIYPLNYLANSIERSGAPPDYDAPVSFLAVQTVATAALNYVTGAGSGAGAGAGSRRQIVLFSNPLTPVELIPGRGAGCTGSTGMVVPEGGVVAKDYCVHRGIAGNLNRAANGGLPAITDGTDWFYDHAAALTSSGKSNAGTYPTVVVRPETCCWAALCSS